MRPNLLIALAVVTLLALFASVTLAAPAAELPDSHTFIAYTEAAENFDTSGPSTPEPAEVAEAPDVAETPDTKSAANKSCPAGSACGGVRSSGFRCRAASPEFRVFDGDGVGPVRESLRRGVERRQARRSDRRARVSARAAARCG